MSFENNQEYFILTKIPQFILASYSGICNQKNPDYSLLPLACRNYGLS